MKTKKKAAKPAAKKLLRRNPRKAAIKRKVRRAQPVHKRLLLHPVSILTLLCAGVFIVGWTFKVVADDFTVSAVVPAPTLLTGAAITDPIDGQVITAEPINVTGTCPAGSYVKLMDNSLLSGTSNCSSGGTFEIATDLFSGSNALIAQDYNTTDQPGPATPTVTVSYQPAQPPAAPPSATSGGGSSVHKPSGGKAGPAATPLLLTADFHYETFTTNSSFTWNIGVQGGTAPYTITIAWGDGQVSAAGYSSAQTFQITHVYKNPGYYPIKVYATDNSGDQRLLQIAAFVKLPGAHTVPVAGGTVPAGPSGSVSPFQNFLQHAQNWLWLAWPSFIIVVLMVFSFWLGERQEYIDILRGRRPRGRHA